MSIPYLINFPSVGSSELGYISIAEFEKNIPFPVKRSFWSYYTPQNVVRGKHAHHQLEQILVAVTGSIIIYNEDINGNTYEHKIETPDIGIYIPPFCWHTMKFSHNAVMLSFASMQYVESDYIRNYEDFKKLQINAR